MFAAATVLGLADCTSIRKVELNPSPAGSGVEEGSGFQTRMKGRDEESEKVSLAELNAITAGRKCMVTFTGLRTSSAYDLEIRPDSTFWRGVDSEVRIAVPTTHIAWISVSSRSSGAMQGLGYGVLTGATAGALLGLVISQGEPRDGILHLDAGDSALLGAMVFGGAGSVVGLFLGASTGSEELYILHGDEEIAEQRFRR